MHILLRINIFFAKKVSLGIWGIVIFSFLLYKGSIAQQVEFSQFYTAPLHLNPALAGISHGPRLAMNYRNQWPELGDGPNGGFVSYALSYDQHVEKIRGGVGLLFLSDRISNNTIVQNSIHAGYSYQIRASKNLGIKIGLQGIYTHRYIDWHELLFADQIDPLTGFFSSIGVPYPTSEVPPANFSKHLFNASTGLVVFSHNHYGGLAISNIIPEKDFFNGETRRIRVAMHGGSIFPIGRPYRQKFYIAPQFLYVFQNNFNQITVGTLLGYDFIYTGIWLRHTIENFDAVISGIGFKKGVLRFGYSFDINVSPLQGTTGSHEFSFVFNFTKEKNSLYPTYIQGFTHCPYFLDF